MIHVLLILFSWPNGIVVGNLIASAICVVVAAVHIERLAKRHHSEHLALIARHHKEHLAHLARLAQPDSSLRDGTTTS